MQKINRWFSASIDSRSLGLFRVIFGLSLIYNVVFQRLFYVGSLINNKKLIPHEVIDEYYGAPLPLFRLFESDLWAYGYLLVLLGLFILFTLGKLPWWLRLVTFILYGIVNASYTYLSHGPEFLMETALFWSVLLPVNSSFQFRNNQQPKTIQSFIVTGFYLQLFLIYLSSWLLKDGIVWQSNQVMEILAYERIHATEFLVNMKDSISLLRWFTAFGFWLEVIVSILLLISIKVSRLRWFTAVSILLLHSSMVLLLSVGHFWILGLAFSCLFLPATIWKKLGSTSSNQYVIIKNLSPVKAIGLALLILFVLHGNMYAWKKQGYLSKVMKQLPLSDVLLRSHYKDPGMASGFYHQSWRFFSGDIPPDLGDFVYVGIDDNGIEYELNSGEKLTSINNFQFSKNNYKNAEFVFAVYLKFYQNRFPDSSLQEWLRLQANDFKKNSEYKAYKLYHHKRTFTVTDPMKIDDQLVELVSLKKGL